MIHDNPLLDAAKIDIRHMINYAFWFSDPNEAVKIIFSPSILQPKTPNDALRREIKNGNWEIVRKIGERFHYWHSELAAGSELIQCQTVGGFH